MILALDPGHTQSGWVVYDGGRVVRSGIWENSMLQTGIAYGGLHAAALAIEMIASYGMPVGREVFETCVWIGRFVQSWPNPDAVRLVYRRDVKLELCGTARAKDANIRQALIDRVGPTGTKRQPGPTYGVKGDMWAALAVAVVATHMMEAA